MHLFLGKGNTEINIQEQTDQLLMRREEREDLFITLGETCKEVLYPHGAEELSNIAPMFSSWDWKKNLDIDLQDIRKLMKDVWLSGLLRKEMKHQHSSLCTVMNQF